MKIQKSKMFLLLSLVLVITLSACGGEEIPIQKPVESVSLETVVSEGHISPAKDSWLNFAVQGRIDEILVGEGEQVSKDQVLMRLADREGAEAAFLDAELELTRAHQEYDDFLRMSELKTAQAWQVYLDAETQRGEIESEWEDLNIEFLEDQIDDARIEVRDLEDDLEDAQDEWDKYQDVDESNYARKAAEDDLEDAQESYNKAQRDLEEAIREIDDIRADLDAALAAEAEAKREYEMWLEEGVDLDQQTLLESRVSAAEAGVIAAQNALNNYTLTAPFAGVVTDITFETGQFVRPESWAAQLADLSEFKVETSDLTELEVVKIKEGQTVEIVPDALPDILLTGKVEQIGESFTTQAGDVIYKVTIALDDNDPNLRWGMTVELTFLPD